MSSTVTKYIITQISTLSKYINTKTSSSLDPSAESSTAVEPVITDAPSDSEPSSSDSDTDTSTDTEDLKTSDSTDDSESSTDVDDSEDLTGTDESETSTSIDSSVIETPTAPDIDVESDSGIWTDADSEPTESSEYAQNERNRG